MNEAYPCPCGGKVKWKKERVIRDGIDCGTLDIEYCPKCGEEYLPETSAQIVENKLKEAGLWEQRNQILELKSIMLLLESFY